MLLGNFEIIGKISVVLTCGYPTASFSLAKQIFFSLKVLELLRDK
jgi:hypothetical protein